ncbi:hypothetical protein F4808DRAFT_192327 [Astrocystis sublimbata]|nr:hypothetical protein F4808DRAFT_192327 [Astrocystis sublimbata]
MMTYLHAPNVDSSAYPLYAEVPVSPEVKRSDSPIENTDGTWTVGRYLTDNKSSFSFYSAMDPISSGTVTPFPPQFQRPGSPSYTNSSSTCSSGLSPPRETDYCPQVYSPPTPSEAPLLPPFESWSSHPQVYLFTGLAEGCVNLGDVNPIQEFPTGYYDESIQGFDFPTRTCSLSSDASVVSHAAWNEGGSPRHPRDLSPDTSDIKEEIRIPDAMARQLTPETDLTDHADAPGSPCLKSEPQDDDEDGDYSPYSKSRNGVTKSSRIDKTPKRRRTSQSSPDVKRLKTAMEASVVAHSAPKASIQGAKGQYTCSECHKQCFKDQTSLNTHIKKQHTRPFTCIFEFAGCHSTFASKNEWKRHCLSQHIVLNYWVCEQGGCAQVSNQPKTPKRSSAASRKRSDCPRYPAAHPSALPNGTIFNRKDLYTQHLRRMHVPTHLKNKVKSKSHVPEWEERQREHQDKAIRTRCHLPTHMRCPSPGCNVRFDGSNAWDDRMEHVAKHLEKAAAGGEPPLQFSGDADGTLVDWATSPAIGILKREDKGRWVLQNPLKIAAGGFTAPVPVPVPPPTIGEDDEDSDADAEGELVDE